MSDEAVEDVTLYSKVAELYGTPFDPDGEDSAEEWKENAVRFFNDMEDDAFEALPEDVAAWVNEAAEVVKKNRGARRQKPLPALDGLDEGDAEKPAKKARKAKAEKAPKAPKEPKEPIGRDPTASRYYRAAIVLIRNPGIDEVKLGELLLADGHDYSEVTINRAFDAYDKITSAQRAEGVLAAAE